MWHCLISLNYQKNFQSHIQLAKQWVDLFFVNMFSLFVTAKLEIYIYHHKRHVKKLVLLHVGHCGHYWNKWSTHTSYQIVQYCLRPHIHQVYTCTQLYGINGFLYTYVDISGSGNSYISPTTGTSSLPQDTVCADQFVKVNGTCYPRCDSFEQSPHDVTVSLKAIRLFAACYGFTVGIVVLILSFLRWKTMYVNVLQFVR